MDTDWALIYCLELGSSKLTDRYVLWQTFSCSLIQKNLERNKCNLIKCSQDLCPLFSLKVF